VAPPTGSQQNPTIWHLKTKSENKWSLKEEDFRCSVNTFSSNKERMDKFIQLNATRIYDLMNVRIFVIKETMDDGYTVGTRNDNLLIGRLEPMANLPDQFSLLFDRTFAPVTNATRRPPTWEQINHIKLEIAPPKKSPPPPPPPPPDTLPPGPDPKPSNPDNPPKPNDVEDPDKVVEPPPHPDKVNEKSGEKSAAAASSSDTHLDQETAPKQDGVIKRTINRLRNFWPTWILLLPIWPIVSLIEWLLKPVADEEL